MGAALVYGFGGNASLGAGPCPLRARGLGHECERRHAQGAGANQWMWDVVGCGRG